MGWLDKFIRGISPNPKGRRGLTNKDKKNLRGKKRGDVDHIKPIALHKSKPIFDLMGHYEIDVNTKSGRPPKHSYDRKNNLQVLSKSVHKKKTKRDIKRIREKKEKELDNWGFGGN